MANRHLARAIAMQSLFEWDFRGNPTAALPAIIEHNIKEFGAGLGHAEFTEEIINGVIEHLPKIDELISKYAPSWPINQITIVDRNILRIGIYELRFCPGMPPRVAINEAIEIAKSYGGPSSGKFVNGVLGSMYNDMPKDTSETSVDQLNSTPAVPEETPLQT